MDDEDYWDEGPDEEEIVVIDGQDCIPDRETRLVNGKEQPPGAPVPPGVDFVRLRHDFEYDDEGNRTGGRVYAVIERVTLAQLRKTGLRDYLPRSRTPSRHGRREHGRTRPRRHVVRASASRGSPTSDSDPAEPHTHRTTEVVR